MNFFVHIKSIICFLIMFFVANPLVAYEKTMLDSGVASIVGRANEDRFVIEDLPGDCKFYAVYDGHGGSDAVDYVADNLHKNIIASNDFPSNIQKVLKKAYWQTDATLEQAKKGFIEGTTAIVAVVTPKGKIFVANAGDSRAMVVKRGEVILQTKDHKPSDSEEKKRIEAAEGSVYNGRIGMFAVSRALGDFICKTGEKKGKRQYRITPDPDIYKDQFKGTDNEFMVLACDGLWDVMDCKQVSIFVKEKLHEHETGQEISDALVKKARELWEKEARSDEIDDITAIVVVPKKVGDVE